MLTRDGSIVCSSFPTLPAREEFIQWLSSTADTQERVLGFQGERYIATRVFVTDHWIVGVVAVKALSFGEFNQGMVVVLVTIGLAGLILVVFSARWIVFPVSRLIRKTDDFFSIQPPSDEEITTDSFGEWSEIECKLDDLKRDMEKKDRRLEKHREELSAIASSISDAIVAVKPDGSPIFFNTRFKVLFPDRKLESEWSLWELVRDPEVLDRFSEALKEGKSSVVKTFSLDTVEGKRCYFRVSVSPLRRRDLSIYGAVGVFHDVSELKTAEQMRIDFVANVSHELRTPLTSIKGYSDTLKADAEQGRPIDGKALQIIEKNTHRLISLIEDLLDLSSIESDAVLHKEALPILEFTQRVLEGLKKRADAKRQTFVLRCEAVDIRADGPRLEQVLVNLVDNAMKYGPPGGEIVVSWTRDGVNTVLSVSDSGPGIGFEHQGRLFERFYRVDRARSRELGGTGLGLAIVKHIMERHDGSVIVESAAGRGATFRCYFPGG
jgi:two-component system phosphate regulon sensor histidine kinase PhoR